MSDDENGAGDEPIQHVQLSFFTKENTIKVFPEAAFDVPTTANCENLNVLVNKSIEVLQAAKDSGYFSRPTYVDDWTERRFEFLIGETFLRTSLKEFIDEYRVETETEIKVECVLGLEAPKPSLDLQAPDWVSTVNIRPYHIVSTTYSGEIVVWDKKGNQLGSCNHDRGTAYKCAAVLADAKNAKSLDGYQIIAAGENQICTLYEGSGSTLTPKTVFRGHERSVECVSINSAKTRFISGGFDSHIKVWNLEDDTATIYEKSNEEEKSKKRKENFVTKTPMVTLGGHKDAVVGLCWATWNPALAISASWDNSIVVWDLELAGEVSKIRGQKALTSIDVNDSGLVISSATDSTPRLYDPRSKDGSLVKQSFIGHVGWVSQVKWNPKDDRCFVSASFDKSVKMWDIRSAKTSLFDLYGHEDRVLCASWGEGLVASGSVDTTIKVFAT